MGKILKVPRPVERVDLETLEGGTYALLYIWADEHGRAKTVEQDPPKRTDDDTTP